MARLDINNLITLNSFNTNVDSFEKIKPKHVSFSNNNAEK